MHVPLSLGYVNSHMPVTDPGTSEPGGVIEFLGSGDCFDTPSHTLCFCSLRSQYNEYFKHCILTSVEVYASSAVNCKRGCGWTPALHRSTFACVLNRA